MQVNLSFRVGYLYIVYRTVRRGYVRFCWRGFKNVRAKKRRLRLHVYRVFFKYTSKNLFRVGTNLTYTCFIGVAFHRTFSAGDTSRDLSRWNSGFGVPTPSPSNLTKEPPRIEAEGKSRRVRVVHLGSLSSIDLLSIRLQVVSSYYCEYS